MKGTCENCHKKNVQIRRFKAIGMFNEDRGYFSVCLECFKGRIWSDP